jgi:hypothetical protein
MRSNIRSEMTMIESIDDILNTFGGPLVFRSVHHQSPSSRSDNCLSWQWLVLLSSFVPLTCLRMIRQEFIYLIGDCLFIIVFLLWITIFWRNFCDERSRFGEVLMTFDWMALSIKKFFIDRTFLRSRKINLCTLRDLLFSESLIWIESGSFFNNRSESDLR